VLRTEEVDLGAVITQAIETAGPLVAARDHHLDVQLPEQQVWVMGDPVRLAQSVGNLLHNAAKFTPTGGELSVAVSLSGNERVQIAVEKVFPYQSDVPVRAEVRLETSPGDYVFVPPFVPHREENPTGEEAVVVIARSSQDAIVVNLPGLTAVETPAGD